MLSHKMMKMFSMLHKLRAYVTFLYNVQYCTIVYTVNNGINSIIIFYNTKITGGKGVR